MLAFLGAGAALFGLVSAVPQLIRRSAHSDLVFGVIGAALFGSGAMPWRALQMPCPTEPTTARRCTRLRRASQRLYGLAVTASTAGVAFAFVPPRVGE